MKRLNVVQRARGWFVTGLSSGQSLEIFRQIPYPESEWPEVGEIKGRKEMHQALYDLWQTSEALETENKKTGKGGLFFHTPFGDFATYSYEVVAAEDLGRIAHELLEDRDRARQRVTHMVMAQQGFGPKQMEKITAKYGSRFDAWPKDLLKAYWKASDLAQRSALALAEGRQGIARERAEARKAFDPERTRRTGARHTAGAVCRSPSTGRFRRC